MAFKCPVLEGPWELAAWTLVMGVKFNHRYGAHVSSQRTSWVIKVIADPDMCPNPYLRFELMMAIYRLIDVSNCDSTLAIKSVLSACACLTTKYLSMNVLHYHQTQSVDSVLSGSSSLNLEYLEGDLLESYDLDYPVSRLFALAHILKTFAEDASEFDKNLAAQLKNVKSSRCSALLHGVNYCYAMNPNSFNQPRELNGLIALLNTLSESISQVHKLIKNKIEPQDLMYTIGKQYNVIYIFLDVFQLCSYTPQLFGLTVSCLKGMRKLLLQIKVDLPDKSTKCDDILGDILKLLMNYDYIQ